MLPLADGRAIGPETGVRIKDGPQIVGVTPTGRATIRLLQMNTKPRLELRAWLIEGGLW